MFLIQQYFMYFELLLTCVEDSCNCKLSCVNDWFGTVNCTIGVFPLILSNDLGVGMNENIWRHHSSTSNDFFEYSSTRCIKKMTIV